MSDIQQPQPIPLQPNPQIVPPSPPSPSDALAQRISNTFAAGGGGILNQLLFGIPGRTFAKGLVQQAQADPTSNLAYNIGQGAGAAGSMAVSPVGLLGKAVGAVPALAKTGSAIANLGTKGNVLGGLARGALEGGAFTGLQNVGANNPNAGSDILKSAALGGVLGGAGSLAGGILSRLGRGQAAIPGKLAEQMKESNAKVLLGAAGVPASVINKVSRFGLTSDQWMARATKAKSAEQQAADIVADEIGSINPDKLATWYDQEVTKPWGAMAQAWDSSGDTLANHMQDILQLPEVKGLSQNNQAQLMAHVLNASPENFYHAKSSLADLTEEGILKRGVGHDQAQQVGDAAYAVKKWLEENAGQKAVQQGLMSNIDLDRLRTIYPAAKIIAGTLAKDAAKTEGIKAGSDTMPKLLIGAMLGGELGGTGIQQQLRELAGGLIGAAGGNVLNQGITRGMNALVGKTAIGARRLMNALPTGGTPNVPAELGPTLMGTVPLASRVGGALAPAVTAPMPQNQPATQAPVTVQDPAKFNDALSKGILLRIQQDVRYNPMLLNNPQWLAQAQAGVRNAISTNGKIDYQKAAPFLFNNPQDVEAYTRYAVPMMQIDTLLDQAGVGLGAGAFAKIRGALTPAVIQSRQGIVEAVQRATGSPAAAREAQAALTYAGWNKAQIEQRLKDILQRYAPNPGKLKGLLEQTGEM